MDSADNDESGTIDFPEFLSLMSKVLLKSLIIFWLKKDMQVLGKARSEAHIRDAFRVFDKDDDGFIAVSFKFVLTQHSRFGMVYSSNPSQGRSDFSEGCPEGAARGTTRGKV